MPTAEPESEGSFITEEPLEILKKGLVNDVPVIAGITNGEGLLMTKAKKDDSSMEDFVPACVKADKGSPKSLEVAKVIENFYFTNSTQMDAAYYNLSSASMFMWPLAETYLNLKHHKSPHYVYLFEYVGTLNFAKQLLQVQYFRGACHGDDVGYLFKTLAHPVSVDEEALSMINKLVSMWTNFAITGQPTEEDSWQPYGASNRLFYRINVTSRLDNGNLAEDVRFWSHLCGKYGGSS